MKRRILSILLAACMALSLIPAVELPVRAGNDPVYNHAELPEVAIFNAQTGANEKYYKEQMAAPVYNAVSGLKFRKPGWTSVDDYLTYDTKVTEDSIYVWNNFFNTRLAQLSDRYQQLQCGFAITRTSNSHTHRWKLIYSADLTSYMNTDLYLSDAAHDQYWSVADYRGFTRAAATMRDWNEEFTSLGYKIKFSSLGYTINGANSRYATVGGVDQSQIRKNLYLSFSNSVLKYDGQDKTCTCGGSATGASVGFYDGVAPTITSVEIKNGETASTNFKKGDTVTIVLNISEAIRFADHNATGKGDIVIGLEVDGRSDRLYANLTRLDPESLTFTYQVPEEDTELYSIAAIDLASAPKDKTALIHDTPDIDLKQVYSGNVKGTYPAKLPVGLDDPLGFTKTTSQITDMAGNALVDSVPAVSFYIDCEDPFVAKAKLSAETNNGDVKAALGKTDMDPADTGYTDNSDAYLGAGDRFSLTLYMNEVVTGTNAVIVTNVKNADGSFLTFPVTSSGITASKGIGSQYGRGASRGMLTVFYTDPVTITDDMTVDGGEIRITDVTFTDVKDASGNAAVGSVKDLGFSVDTVGPTAAVGEAVQNGVNQQFYVPFRVMETDVASGVYALPATLIVTCGELTNTFDYAVTISTSEPASWETNGAFGSAISFVQVGGTQEQYLHIRPQNGQIYDFNDGNAEITFYLADYAGNRSDDTSALTGACLDKVLPNAAAKGSARSYDNISGVGTLSVAIHAEDPGGLASVQYQWADPAIAESAGLTGEWSGAVGTLDDHMTSADMTADAEVASQTAFRQRLWVKVTDAAGNESVTDLGEYAYSLSPVSYTLDYSAEIKTTPGIKVSALDEGGRLVFDVQKSGNDANTHYVSVVDAAGDADIFGGTWYSAKFSGTEGYRFTDLANAGAFLSNYTGNLYVTVYSGNSETIGKTDEAITVTTNAGVASVPLRVSASGNDYGEVFDGTDVLSADNDTLAAMGNGVKTLPWTYGSKSGVSSTLEGRQLSIRLGSDINGWGHEDINWQKSFIALCPGGYAIPDTLDGLREKKLCGIGSGHNQTVTLPARQAADRPYDSGYYHLVLVLARNSDPNTCYTVVLQNGNDDARVNLDVSEPGRLSLGVLAREDPARDGEFAEIPYDPEAPIYIPTEGCEVTLSVEALDAEGKAVSLSGGDNYAGTMDIVAWNTSDSANKISLSRMYLSEDEEGTIRRTQAWDSYPSNGKRTLRFGSETDDGGAFSNSTLGVVPDRDNTVALQIRYANGKSSAVTYLTVHPVSMGLTGTITTVPTVDESIYGPFWQGGTTGLITADPGSAAVVFTPDAPVSEGLTVYCREGYECLRNQITSHVMYGGDGGDTGRMTLRSDGSYVLPLDPTDGKTSGIIRCREDGTMENVLESVWEPQGYYVVYAEDAYGNMKILGVTRNAILADGFAPMVTDRQIVTEDGAYTATFRICDDSLYAFGRAKNDSDTDKPIPRPMTLTLSYDGEYAAAIGAPGESLTLTADAAGERYVWTPDSANKLGICEVSAELTREGKFTEGYANHRTTTYYNGAVDVYLTVTVKGMVDPRIETATPMTLNLTAVDAHGNKAEQASVSAAVVGKAPQLTAMELRPVEQAPWTSDLALFTTFSVPVQPAESWIRRDITGYQTEWGDAFPITNDGVWNITFTDVFGTVYTQTVDTADYKGEKDGVFGVYGFDLEFSTLDYVPDSRGVTITASYTGTDGRSLHIYKGNETLTPDDGSVDRLTGRTATVTENGDYTVYLYGESNWSDKTHIHLNNIISGAPTATLYFYFDEFKEQYAAGSHPRGETTGPVTVSYRTDRETSPVGATTITIRDRNNDAFSFQYYDVPTNQTYTISGRLSDNEYGVKLAAPETPYADTEKPTIDLVTIWTRKGGGFAQANAFSGNAADADIGNAIADSGYAQSYDFVVNASDYSRWKIVVKSAVPESMSYSAAASDEISGVTVQGNNVLVTKKVTDSFCIVVVDNAKADSAADADNFSCIRIPADRYRFDTTPPEIDTITVTESLWSKSVYIRATDKADDHNATDGVTITGTDVVREEAVIDGKTYTHKLVFRDNDTEVAVTAVDGAGNSKVERLKVTGIDVSVPKLTVTWSPCFKDPSDGRLRQSSPTAGPVNTDVTAHITSDKEIAYVLLNGYRLDRDDPEMQLDRIGNTVSYTSRYITVRFVNVDEDEGAASCQLEVFAPNGKSAKTTVSIGADVIDKTEPYVLIDEVTEYTRTGYGVPYAEQHAVTFSEDVYCLDGGTAGTVYNRENPFVVTLTDDDPREFRFTDKAGNLSAIEVWPQADAIDSVTPTLTVEVPDAADAVAAAVRVQVTVDEENCTLTANDSDAVTCGALTRQDDGAGNTVWAGTVSVSRNGTFRLTAADKAGNERSVVFTVNNIDRTLPAIRFAGSTVNVRQDSAYDELKALLDGGVTTWDNAAIRDGSLRYDTTDVRLNTPGVYTVSYTVEDTAGNVGLAARYVKVIDKNQIDVRADGMILEQDGITGVSKGEHRLTVAGLKAPDEPYKIQLVKGLWSAGQMKRISGGVTVGADGSFTLPSDGFYTLYITTQSRQVFRALFYAEN